MRTESIRVRVTPELRRAIQAAAARDGRTVSDWIRRHLAGMIPAHLPRSERLRITRQP